MRIRIPSALMHPSIVVAALVSLAAAVAALPSAAQQAAPEAPPTAPPPPKPTVLPQPSEAWVARQDTTGRVDLVLFAPSTRSMVLVQVVPPSEFTVDEMAAGLQMMFTGQENTHASSVESGTVDGLAFAAFQTGHVEPGVGLVGGAFIVRDLAGSPYRIVVRGMWPVQHHQAALDAFQAAVRGLHVATPEELRRQQAPQRRLERLRRFDRTIEL